MVTDESAGISRSSILRRVGPLTIPVDLVVLLAVVVLTASSRKVSMKLLVVLLVVLPTFGTVVRSQEPDSTTRERMAEMLWKALQKPALDSQDSVQLGLKERSPSNFYYAPGTSPAKLARMRILVKDLYAIEYAEHDFYEANCVFTPNVNRLSPSFSQHF